MKVPVRNVYYLLLYAWEHLGEGEEVAVADVEYAQLQDLFADVLADAVARILARGLDRGYLTREEPVRGVRGKLDLSTTLKRNLAANAQTHCRSDELQYDVLHNRILKATLRTLLTLDVDERIRPRLRRIYRKLDAVTDVRISLRDFGRVQLHRNNRLYDFALRLCRLIHENLLPAEGGGGTRFRDFRADERQMGALFEEFVRNFFRRHLPRYSVSTPHLRWYDAQGTPHDLQALPVMRTDMVLEAPGRRIILDTKFYAEPLEGRHGSRKVRSAHLYQILAYVDNLGAARPATPPHEGMLLYPVVRDQFTFDFRLAGRHVAVRSLDLDQPWPAIHADLLQLLPEEEEEVPRQQ